MPARTTRTVVACLGSAWLACLGSAVAPANGSATAHAQSAPPPQPQNPYGQTPAAAPYDAAPQRPHSLPERRGFTLGFTLGAGSFDVACESAGCVDFFGGESTRFEGPSFTFHVGGMVTEDLAILFDLWGVGHSPDDRRRLWHNIGDVALRWFPHRLLWLQGGAGWANFNLHTRDCAPGECTTRIGDTGFALVGGAGLELVQTRHFALDAALRVAVGAYGTGGSVNMTSLQLGFNWY